MNRLCLAALLISVLFLSAAGSVLPLGPQSAGAQTGAAQTTVESSLQVNLGTIPNATFPLDDALTHVFTVTNTGSRNLTIAVAAYNSQGAGVPSYPQPGVFTLEPNEQRKVSVLVDEGSGLFPEVTPPPGGQLAAGSYTVPVKWVIQNQNNVSDVKTFTVDYPIRVIDPAKTYCEMHVAGKVTDPSGSPVANMGVVLTAAANANYIDQTGSDGSYSFCVPKYSGWVLSTSSTAGGQPYQPRYVFVTPGVSTYNIVVTPASNIATANFSLVKQVSTHAGFWMGQPSADGSMVLLTQGMEIWPQGADKAASDLLLYRTDGTLLWNYSMGWESWAASLSPDGKYATYVTLNGTDAQVGLLNATTGTPIWVQTMTNSTFPVNPQTLTTQHNCRAIQISGDDRYIGLGCSEGGFYLLSTATGQVVWYRYLVGQVRNVKFSSDGQYVYIGTDPYLFKYGISTQAMLWKADIGGWPLSDGMVLSQDGSFIATMSKNGFTTAVNTRDGSVRWSADTEGIGQFAAVSPDGSKVVGDSFGGFWVYDAKTGTPLWRVTSSKDGRFSSDGNFVVGPSDSVLTANGSNVQTMVVPGNNIPGWYQFVYISPDLTRIVASVACCGGYQSTGIYFYSGSISYFQGGPTTTTSTSAGSTTSIPPSPGGLNVAISPTSGPSGTRVTITGSGLTQSHQFRYCVQSGLPPQPPSQPTPCPASAPTFTTLADGSVPSSPPVTLVVTGPPGPYTVAISDTSSPFVAPLTFAVTSSASTTAGSTSTQTASSSVSSVATRSTSTQTSPLITSAGPANTTTQTASASATGGGVSEFPLQPAAFALAALVVVSYLAVRGRYRRTRPQSR